VREDDRVSRARQLADLPAHARDITRDLTALIVRGVGCEVDCDCALRAPGHF
jgi:hypothetical protein